MTPAPLSARDQVPPEGVLQQLRIPFVRRVTLVSPARTEEAFMIDIGLAGAFIERAEPMAVDLAIEIQVPWPGSEIAFRASCRVAWWHPEGAPLASKVAAPGGGAAVRRHVARGPRSPASAARGLLPAEPARAALPAPLARRRAAGRRPHGRLTRMARVRVVLVRPETSANVGACARVVRNTGSAGLDLVSPGDFRTVECWRTAWGAHEVLEAARVFDDLTRRSRASTLAVALTGRRPAGTADRGRARRGGGDRRARPRRRGGARVRPRDERPDERRDRPCGRAATIPADPAQPSYNLSHAVAIAAYEVRRAGRRTASRPRAHATHDQKERLLELLEAGLVAIGALPPARRASYFAEWRALVQRIDLTPKELRLVEHMARKMKRAAG